MRSFQGLAAKSVHVLTKPSSGHPDVSAAPAPSVGGMLLRKRGRMIRLAVFLMGLETMRRQWPSLAVLGVLWFALGLVIMLDAADGMTVVITETFGYLLVAEGLVAVIFSLGLGRRGRFFLARALVMMVLGLLVVDLPWRNDLANSVLFGIAFLLDGAIRLAAAFLVRYSRWRVVAALALVEIGLAGLAFSSWPIPYTKTVPFCIGVALFLSGFTFLRLALGLRRLPPAAGAWPLFAKSRWLPPPADPALFVTPDVPELLMIRVWTPAGAAREARSAPVVDRYIAAVDRNGVVSTGHAALECGSDIYVSHYPGTELDLSLSAFTRALRADAANNMSGRFQPSYPHESARWREADALVKFHRFDAAKLRAHWSAYREDDTYNLTDRNCSVAVALALEAALEGVLATDKVWRRFMRLLVNPDLWLAAALRERAEAMTWTPGLVLDYAHALRRVVHPAAQRWPARIHNALREHRRVRAERQNADGTAPV
ncbi:HdeD family acid-resistance protein [Microvirga rosea]|uniref:HdeD family acid-resistance protein n=1 Tax=Microvirga rosea TaxID=2715425 RepID=UPI001D0B3F92|nr:DUF308 domain-containing protein [Microvirga rosea]MCB8819717.1 DUF308 domain-containing protein [Microvirga rosea]